MKISNLVLVAMMCGACLSAYSQTVVVNDPTAVSKESKITAAEKAIFDRDALPAARARVKDEACDPKPEVSGVIRGAISKPGARQSLIFYQLCETGNGFATDGLVLIEGDHVIGNFLTDTGWAAGIDKVDDIDQNGVLEFVLAFSSGMHQGHGAVGIDLVEFQNGVPTGLGFYKAEEYAEAQATTAWKLTAKPGKVPVFYRQKFFSGESEKYRASGGPVVFELDKPYSKFEVLK